MSLDTVKKTTEVTQATHDNLNLNANIQVGNADVAGGNPVPISGTVTANAGTNLNTSALALEAGGNLAGAATSLAIIDDWDETDRAKVNVIVGQAGITAGAGAVEANTPRVTHASDDPVTTSVQLIDDVIITDNAGFTDGTTKLAMDGFIFDEVAGTALTENDAAAARIDSKRAQVLTIEDETTRGRRLTITAANAAKVDGSAVTQPVSIAATVTVDTELPTAAALADNTANPTAPAVGAFLMGWDATGANWDRVQIGAPSSDNVTTSSFPGILTTSALYAYDGTNMDRVRLEASVSGLMVGGSTADAASEAGNPVSMGLTARQTNRTAVSDGQRVRAIADDIGRSVTILNQVRDLVNDQTTTISNTTETTIFTAVASVFNDVVMMILTNTSQTGTRVDIRDTTAGSVRWAIFLVPGGSAVIPFAVPLKQATVNTNWTAQLSTAVTDVRIFVQVVRNV